MKRHLITATVAIAFMLPLAAAWGQSSSGTDVKPPYIPGLGEFMTLAQIRHAKLWLAGNAGNWDLADYEIDELKEGMEDVVKYVPIYKDMQVGPMIESTIMAPISEVEQAIKARDRNKFASAFDKLTQACNSCHQAANRPFIVMQRPDSSSFANQSFAPRRR